MAYKAVLIDDNKNTVLSLEYSIEWENLGIELAGTAYDGRSGAISGWIYHGGGVR